MGSITSMDQRRLGEKKRSKELDVGLDTVTLEATKFHRLGTRAWERIKGTEVAVGLGT
jgi:hypothetical protein